MASCLINLVEKKFTFWPYPYLSLSNSLLLNYSAFGFYFMLRINGDCLSEHDGGAVFSEIHL
jgi:hypothetical protein